MALNYQGRTFLTDNDLKVNVLGFFPGMEIKNLRLKEIFERGSGRDFLGGDEIIAYSQSLVSGGMDFVAVEDAILGDIDAGKELKKTVFNKAATGIGRGHSLGGLSGIVLGIHGTKMIDSGLTGFCMSRSLVTSSRRRETTSEEIAVPECLRGKDEMLNEYLEISRDVFRVAEQFKAQIGKLGGVETFNKVIPYNNPADLFWAVPLDTLAGLSFEVRRDSEGSEKFVPRELHVLAGMLPELAERAGMGIMFRQRVNVPRDTYFHYNVFKNPKDPNYALEKAELNGMSLEPRVVDVHKEITPGFCKGLARLNQLRRETMSEKNPAELTKKAMRYVLALNQFSNEYNESVRLKVADSLSWRVWSEQKRHATLRQNVESVYSGARRAYSTMKEMWSVIQRVASGSSSAQLDSAELEKVIVIDDRLKQRPELLVPYVYHTARQLMFYGKMLEQGFEERDALFIVPKNIRLRTLEHYDLINLIDLEFPLRLCSTCEPERNASSWKKRAIIANALPELESFLQPKCNVGYCTEGKPCKNVMGFREGYDLNFHNAVKSEMLK